MKELDNIIKYIKENKVLYTLVLINLINIFIIVSYQTGKEIGKFIGYLTN